MGKDDDSSYEERQAQNQGDQTVARKAKQHTRHTNTGSSRGHVPTLAMRTSGAPRGSSSLTQGISFKSSLGSSSLNSSISSGTYRSGRAKEKINDSLSKLEISAELFQFVDVDNDGSIDKTEWFAACVKRLDLLDPIFYQIIESNFEKLDVTGDGSINRDDVKELLLKRGERENGASPNHSGSSVQFSNDNGRGGRNRTGSLSPVAENESGDENDPPTAFPESDSNGSAASNRTPLDMGFLPPINPTSTTAY
eukprot:gene15632-28950_t